MFIKNTSIYNKILIKMLVHKYSPINILRTLLFLFYSENMIECKELYNTILLSRHISI